MQNRACTLIEKVSGDVRQVSLVIDIQKPRIIKLLEGKLQSTEKIFNAANSQDMLRPDAENIKPYNGNTVFIQLNCHYKNTGYKMFWIYYYNKCITMPEKNTSVYV